jgi:hypothetical protein
MDSILKMKKFRLVLLALLLTSLISCQNDYSFVIGQTIYGKISYFEEGVSGRMPTFPVVYIQTPTKTYKLEVGFENQGKFKVGDSILLVVQKFKEKK